jgi:AbrB family looped-hinge helix DNA binding protein
VIRDKVIYALIRRLYIENKMVTKYTAHIIVVGNSRAVAIPKPIADGFGLGKGDEVELSVSDDGIFIPLSNSDQPVMICKRCLISWGHYQRSKEKCKKGYNHDWNEQKQEVKQYVIRTNKT